MCIKQKSFILTCKGNFVNRGKIYLQNKKTNNARNVIVIVTL